MYINQFVCGRNGDGNRGSDNLDAVSQPSRRTDKRLRIEAASA